MISLRERQEAHFKRAQTAALREAGASTGYKPEDIRRLFDNDGELFQRTGVKRLQEVALREANAESSFSQLLRAGVQQFLFDGYQQVPVVYPDLVRVVDSNKAEELYGPLYGSEMPVELRPGQPFPDSRLAGLDVRVPNRKFGRKLSVERELVEDDQTGQIVSRASSMGERMRLQEEIVVMAAITGGSYTTAIGNVNSGGGLLSQPLLETAWTNMDTITDPLGNIIAVNVDTLLVSPSDRINARKLINSQYQPSVPGGSGQSASTASSGTTGWTMTDNPLNGAFNVIVSRYLPKAGSSSTLDGTHGAAFLAEAKKSLVFQDRIPLEAVQANPLAGSSFSHDVYEYRVRRRFNVAMIDSRWWFRIN